MNLKERLTQTTEKDIIGNFLRPETLRVIERRVNVYELSPQEAEELKQQGYRLRWVHKIEHLNGEPKLRLYEILGELRLK